MKEVYSIQLEDKEAEAFLEIAEFIDGTVKAIPFSGDIEKDLKKISITDELHFWYEESHIIGIAFFYSNFKKLPKAVGDLSHLRFLKISSYTLQYIPPDLKKLHQLEYFELEKSNHERLLNIEFPDIFQSLNNLKIIRIDGTFELFLPPSFTKLSILREITFYYCLFFTNHTQYLKYTKERMRDVKELTEGDHECVDRLQSLYEKYSRYINELPRDLNELKSLKILNLIHFNREIKLPPSIVNLSNLKEINFAFSNIKDIDLIFNIKPLESLNLSGCRVKSIPHSIKNMKELRELKMVHCQLQEIPHEIISCQKLEYLSLRKNYRVMEKINNWYKYLIQLPNLNHLNIGKAYLGDVPKELLEKNGLEIN